MTQPDLAIVRLHGRNAETWDAKGLTASSERFDYEYGDDELAELATRIVGLADRLADRAFRVVVLVNVNHEDQGIRAARRLERLLAKLMPAPLESRRIRSAGEPAPPGA